VLVGVRQVNVQEAKTHLSRWLREVEAGAEIAIARDGRIIARLVPDRSQARQWGLYEGKVDAAPDAFDPLAGPELDAWDGPGIEPT